MLDATLWPYPEHARAPTTATMGQSSEGKRLAAGVDLLRRVVKLEELARVARLPEPDDQAVARQSAPVTQR